MRKLALAQLAAIAASATASETLVYFGPNTGGDSEGIYFSTLDVETGALSQARLAAPVDNPGFIAVHPNQRLLYSVASRRGDEGQASNEVVGFAIDDDGRLSELNRQPSGGAGPCHVSVTSDGATLMVANYSGGSIRSYPLNSEGRIGEAASTFQHEGTSINRNRQNQAHPHSIFPDADNRRAYVPDLGIDQVKIYQLDPRNAILTPNEPAFAGTEAGGGPRHLAFHPTADYAYVNLELTSQVSTFKMEQSNGALVHLQTLSTLPPAASGDGNTTAEILVHPSGRYLYVSNRGHDSLAAFAIDATDGTLAFLGATPSGGKIPRNFGIDPSGRYLICAHQNSHNVVVFKIDQDTGALEPTGSEIEVDGAICVRFVQR